MNRHHVRPSDPANTAPRKSKSTLTQCEACPQNLLLKEGNHRIANSLQLASSILKLRARDVKSAEAQAVLDEVASAIQVISQIHRRLCQFDDAKTIDIGKYITELCAEIEASPIGGNGARFSYQATGGKTIYCDAYRAVQIGLILTELLTNSAKHAGEKPKCSVVAYETDGALKLVVSDNGPGLPENCQLDRQGIGMKLLQALACGLDGTLTFSPSATGARFLITVPTHSPPRS